MTGISVRVLSVLDIFKCHFTVRIKTAPYTLQFDAKIAEIWDTGTTLSISKWHYASSADASGRPTWTYVAEFAGAAARF